MTGSAARHDDEPVSAAVTEPERLAAAFSSVLRGVGLTVPVASTIAFVEALAALGIDDGDNVYWAARSTLVNRYDDIPAFDEAFRAFWTSEPPGGDEEDRAERHRVPTLALEREGDHGEAAGAEREAAAPLLFSTIEVLRQKDFARYDEVELHHAQAMMSRLRLAGAPRRSARWQHARAGGRQFDVRATVRSSLATGGEAMHRRWRRRGLRLRKMVLLIDISGSMEPYARALLRFVQAAVAGRQRVEAFAFGTRLTRLTRDLACRDPDVALASAAERVLDWSGGTRLGPCLAEFNDTWGLRGAARSAIVVILSDGWDRGDPELLTEQMQRLRRVAHRIIWVNPLKATPGYEPLARGMRAALPFVDDFVAGHSLAALEELASVIGGDRVITDA